MLCTLSITLLMVLIVSCDPSAKYEREEETKIQNYLNANPSQNFELKPSGLYYLDVVVGTGLTPQNLDTAYVWYTIKFLDGQVWDTNVGTTDTLRFLVNAGVYPAGFEEGISYMKEGGKALLLTPSKLAYGAAGSYYIPGYTPLLFDVELIKIKPRK